MAGEAGGRDVLRSCILFLDLDDRAFEVVARQVEDVSVRQGDYVFHEGDVGDAFYVLREGTVKITKNMPDGQKLTVTQLGEGEIVGEMSLISDEPRTSNCVLVSNGRLWKLSREAFERLRGSDLAVYTAVVKNISALLCDRLSTMTSEVGALLHDLERRESEVGDLESRLHRGKAGLLGFLKNLGGGAPQGH